MKRSLITLLLVAFSSISVAQMNSTYIKIGRIFEDKEIQTRYIYDLYMQFTYDPSFEPFVMWTGITDIQQTNELAAGLCFSTSHLWDVYDIGFFNIGVSIKEFKSARLFLMSTTKTGAYRDRVILTCAAGFKPYWRIEMFYRLLDIIDLGFYHNSDLGTAPSIGMGFGFWNIQFIPIVDRENNLKPTLDLSIYLKL